MLSTFNARHSVARQILPEIPKNMLALMVPKLKLFTKYWKFFNEAKTSHDRSGCKLQGIAESVSDPTSPTATTPARTVPRFLTQWLLTEL
jgi:hypothetical protein